MRLSLSAFAIWVLPAIVAASASCSGPDSSCAANEMEETNVLLQMTEVNEDKDALKSDDAIPPKEEKEKGKKGYFGGWWKPKWYRHNPIFNRRRHPTTSPLNLLLKDVGLEFVFKTQYKDVQAQINPSKANKRISTILNHAHNDEKCDNPRYNYNGVVQRWRRLCYA